MHFKTVQIAINFHSAEYALNFEMKLVTLNGSNYQVGIEAFLMNN